MQAFGQLPKQTVRRYINSLYKIVFKTLKVIMFPVYSPSTRTPFIWVRCIFFNKERESATSIFLHPSRSKICWCKEHKRQWLLNRWVYQLSWQVTTLFLLPKWVQGMFKTFQSIKKGAKEEPFVAITST